ncbi:ras guanine nucleotide exchange factor [Phytophthora cinnamomi]|uniref:ras guanine nucleotide exchange factor n=1 Tax=Phytophthora cinnamomi TaxID=4785 RepID=UPI00355972F1|nr:ras guanine nucleotide exchange factor [Phytophthora cinnamomi]
MAHDRVAGSARAGPPLLVARNLLPSQAASAHSSSHASVSASTTSVLSSSSSSSAATVVSARRRDRKAVGDDRVTATSSSTLSTSSSVDAEAEARRGRRHTHHSQPDHDPKGARRRGASSPRRHHTHSHHRRAANAEPDVGAASTDIGPEKFASKVFAKTHSSKKEAAAAVAAESPPSPEQDSSSSSGGQGSDKEETAALATEPHRQQQAPLKPSRMVVKRRATAPTSNNSARRTGTGANPVPSSPARQGSRSVGKPASTSSPKVGSGSPRARKVVQSDDEATEETDETVPKPRPVRIRYETPERGMGGKREISHASLGKLIARLTDAHQYDTEFRDVFLLTFRSFCSPYDFIKKLLKRYTAVLSLCGGVDAETIEETQRLLDQITLEEESEQPQELADQLTLMEADQYFSKLNPRELTNKAWTRENKHREAPHVMALIELFDATAEWVSSEILHPQLQAVERAKMITLFIDAADNCYQMNNFNTLFEITTGLSAPCIRQLNTTWSLVSAAAQEKYQCLQQVCSPDDNYRSYRQAFALAEGQPRLACWFILVKDLFTYEEAMKSMEDGLVNWQKFRKIYRVISEALERQNFNYVPPSTNGANGASTNNTGGVSRKGRGILRHDRKTQIHIRHRIDTIRKDSSVLYQLARNANTQESILFVNSLSEAGFL